MRETCAIRSENGTSAPAPCIGVWSTKTAWVTLAKPSSRTQLAVSCPGSSAWIASSAVLRSGRRCETQAAEKRRQQAVVLT